MVTVGALLMGGASACSYIEPSGAAPTDPPASGTLATTQSSVPATTSPSFDPDATVPSGQGSAVGCVDEAGTVRAPAGQWYQPGAAGALALTGEFVTTERFVDFTNDVDDAVGAHAVSFTASGASELARSSTSCVSYRSVHFTRDDEAVIIVAVWRVEGATDPFWVPNEEEFVARDDSTIVSEGAHIVVALVVAPDGTTVRVSAYGAHAIDFVAGWPSTITVGSDVVPGPAPATVDQVVAIGQQVLESALRR